MSETVAGKALRMRRDRDYVGKHKRYKHTYSVVSEGIDELLFVCDVIGHVATDEVTFLHGTNKAAFSMRPNRKIMPTQWLVKDSTGRDMGRIDQKVFGKGRWVGLDASGMEVFRIVASESLVDKVGKSLFGGTTSSYNIVQGDRLAACVELEQREKTTKSGVRGWLQAWATPSDWVIRFSAEAPDLDIQLVLPAVILLIDLTVAMDSTD
jgi:hypothetical protein